MRKPPISLRRQEKYSSKGKLYVFIDHIFLLCIFFRIIVIDTVFDDTFPRRFRPGTAPDLTYKYIIPMFIFPLFVLLFCTGLQRTSIFKEKVTDWKNTRVWSLMTTALPIAVAFLFSLLFQDHIEPLIVKFPEEYQHGIISSYYLSYIYALLYSIIRALFAFDYYQSFYFNTNRDLVLPSALGYYLLLSIVISFFLPKEWLYMFF